MNNEEHYTEIDLTALLKALWRHIWLIAASVIVIGAMAFSYARFFVTPMYTASALCTSTIIPCRWAAPR